MRSVPILVIMALAIGFAGCGGASSPSPSEPAGSSEIPSAAAPSPSPDASAPASMEASPAASSAGLPASFWIEPAALPLDPATTTIAGLIRERECASGQPPEGRVLEPVVVYGPRAITVTFSVVPRSGDQDCQGNPDFPVTVTLDEPVGDRSILDGSEDPPRDASTTPT